MSSVNTSNRPGNFDSFWGIKFRPNDIVVLKKDNGEVVDVRIESVDAWAAGKEIPVMYRVREIETRIGYPVMQECLKRRQQVDVKA